MQLSKQWKFGASFGWPDAHPDINQLQIRETMLEFGIPHQHNFLPPKKCSVEMKLRFLHFAYQTVVKIFLIVSYLNYNYYYYLIHELQTSFDILLLSLTSVPAGTSKTRFT